MSEILQENLLTGEFTFGFELEAYVDPYEVPTDEKSYAWDEFIDVANVDYLSLYPNVGTLISEYGDNEDNVDYGDDDDDDDDDDSNDDEYDERRANVIIRDLYDFDDVAKIAREKLTKIFPKKADWIVGDFKDFDIKQDGSLGYCGFEWASPKMIFNPSSISECIKFLKRLKEQEITVDKKCGFHTHISFPKMSNKDIAWIICNIAKDDYMIDFVSKLEDDNKNFDIDFIGKYSSNSFLYSLQNAIKSGDFKGINSLLNNSKFRVLRIHPQGTLEWRGPRGFLGDDSLIKTFFVKLYQLTEIIKGIMKRKTIGDYTKENFLSMLDLDYDFDKRNDTYVTLLQRISENPMLLKKLNSVTPTTVKKLTDEYCGEFNGEYIIASSVYTCMVVNGVSVPDVFFVASIINNSFVDSCKEQIIRKYSKQLPIDMFKRYTRQKGWSNEYTVYTLLNYLKAYSSDDILQLIRMCSPTACLTFMSIFKQNWTENFGKDIPKKYINEMINVFGQDKVSSIMS